MSRLTKSTTRELLDALGVEYNPRSLFKDLKRLLHQKIYEIPRTEHLENIHYPVNLNVGNIEAAVNSILTARARVEREQRAQQYAANAGINNVILAQQILRIKDTIVAKLNNGENYNVDLNNADNNTQEKYLGALIESLKNISTFHAGKYLILRLQYGNNLECMRILNNDTLQHILHLIAVLEGRYANTTEDFSESDQAILMGLLDLKGFSLEWYEFKKPKKAGAYFPYYNLNNDLDLSIFGIYHKDEPVNYADNCFILAAINSKLFTAEEILQQHLLRKLNMQRSTE